MLYLIFLQTNKIYMTSITVNIPNHKVSFFKKLMTEMGYTFEENKPRLYNPETGECLNDKTMKVIQDMRSGKEPVYEMKSIDEFKKWCESL